MPTPGKPPEKIPPAAPMVASGGPALPPVIPPREVAVIPPVVKPTSETPPVIVPIPADGVTMPDRDAFVSGSKQPAVPFELSIIGPPKDTSPRAAVFPLKVGEKFGHASDYRWVAGVLDRHQKGGYWPIRYADFAEDDRWGGKVRLLDDSKVKDFQSGDVVLARRRAAGPDECRRTRPGVPAVPGHGVTLVEKGRNSTWSAGADGLLEAARPLVKDIATPLASQPRPRAIHARALECRRSGSAVTAYRVDSGRPPIILQHAEFE